jgi:triacylglycerol esterase/lipase EstA (alpha/beta hydrolase family)
MNNKEIMAMSAVAIMITVMIGGSFLSLTNGQSQKISSNNNTGGTGGATKKPLPVLLIHGYASDASVWTKWEDLLKKDGIPFYPITFYKSDDKCGSAADHAKELKTQVQQILKNITKGSYPKQVNIVGHSKGGLDARVFLANSTFTDNKAVANLIMIGTPNAGSPIAQSSNICKPAVEDLKPGAADTKVGMNSNTKYYTIAGDWNPSLVFNCPQLLGGVGYSQLPKPNDGLVPMSSVESQGYFHDLGHTSNCHSNLLSDKEYQLAKPMLVGK